MRKLLTAIATVTLLLGGSLVWKAEAAMTTGIGSPLTKNYSPLESVACWCGPYRCACGHRYWRRPYYGGYYGYRRPYGYYGYRRWGY